jgi:hypothetical protein
MSDKDRKKRYIPWGGATVDIIFDLRRRTPK